MSQVLQSTILATLRQSLFRPEPPLPQRKIPRLQNYDYSARGAYFITICTHNKQSLFGHLANDKMHPSNFGKIVAEEWQLSSQIRKEIYFDQFIVMPNHIHAILMINIVKDTDMDGDSANTNTLKP